MQKSVEGVVPEKGRPEFVRHKASPKMRKSKEHRKNQTTDKQLDLFKEGPKASNEGSVRTGKTQGGAAQE